MTYFTYGPHWGSLNGFCQFQALHDSYSILNNTSCILLFSPRMYLAQMLLFHFTCCISYTYDIWDFEIEFSIECIERALKERHSSLLVGGSAWLHIDIIHSTQSFSTLFMTLVLEFTPVALSLIDIMNYTLYVLSLCRKLNINSLVNGRPLFYNL